MEFTQNLGQPHSINGCVGAVLFQQQKIDVESQQWFSALFRGRRFFYLSEIIWRRFLYEYAAKMFIYYLPKCYLLGQQL